MKSKASMLTVLGQDRPGIIAAVTGCLYRSGCNLEDISMTILEGQFAMILIVRMPQGKKRSRIDRALGALTKKGKLTLFWKEMNKNLVRGEQHKKGTRSMLITAMGRDRTGIVYHVSRWLAGKGLNITDLNSRILDVKKRPIYAMMLEVDVPKRIKVKTLQIALGKLQRKLKVEVQVHPVERLEL